MSERLQKVLAHAGVASRRAAEKLILAGRVSVNGRVVTQLGTKVDPSQDHIQVDGRDIAVCEEKVYFLYYKPVGVISSVKDPQGRPTVVEQIQTNKRIYPVGRLDYDTSGLLLLTNDGELTYKLTHPKHEIPKTYHATVKGYITSPKIRLLERGVLLEDGWTAPAKCRVMERSSKFSRVAITIHEGRNRQVRRMFAHVGHPVQELCRTKFGFLNLEGLKPGEYRQLTPHEVRRLKRL